MAALGCTEGAGGRRGSTAKMRDEVFEQHGALVEATGNKEEEVVSLRLAKERNFQKRMLRIRFSVVRRRNMQEI